MSVRVAFRIIEAKRIKFFHPMSTTTTESSPERQRTSSAKRLAALCSTLRNSKGSNLFSILPMVLGLDAQSNPHRNSLQAFALVEVMLEDVEREIKNCNLAQDELVFFNPILPEVSTAFSPYSCTRPWNEGRDKFTDALGVKLTSLDLMFGRHFIESELESRDFEELLGAIGSALDSLQELELPERLRDFIAAQLLRIKHAIEQYQFRGIFGVEEAIAAYCGGLVDVSQQVKSGTTPEPSPSTWDRFMDVLTISNGVVTLATNVHKVWPDIARLAHGTIHLLSQ
jgi:hypothetical protein